MENRYQLCGTRERLCRPRRGWIYLAPQEGGVHQQLHPLRVPDVSPSWLRVLVDPGLLVVHVVQPSAGQRRLLQPQPGEQRRARQPTRLQRREPRGRLERAEHEHDHPVLEPVAAVVARVAVLLRRRRLVRAGHGRTGLHRVLLLLAVQGLELRRSLVWVQSRDVQLGCEVPPVLRVDSPRSSFQSRLGSSTGPSERKGGLSRETGRGGPGRVDRRPRSTFFRRHIYGKLDCLVFLQINHSIGIKSIA